MWDSTATVNQAGKHIATIDFNEAYGLWQIVIVQRRELEFFCPTREVAFAAGREEFDPQTGFPRSNLPAVSEA